MIHRLKKIELQNEIFVKAPEYIKFPRLQKKQGTMVVATTLPSNEDIISLIENAKAMAIEDLRKVGIVERENFKINFKCQVSYVRDDSITSDMDTDDLNDDPEEDIELDYEIDSAHSLENDVENLDLQNDLHVLSSVTGELMLKDHSKDVTDNDFLAEDSIFVVVKDSSGKKKVVRKSTICGF